MLKARANPLLGAASDGTFDVKRLRNATVFRDEWSKEAGGSARGNPKKYRRRFMRVEAAAQAVGEIRAGMADLIVSTGQFSLTEAILVAIEQLGPSHLTASTWTVGAQEITTLAAMRDAGAILSARFMVDFTFARRQPQYAAMLRTRFGDDALRITNNHAKWATLRPAAGPLRLAYTTTMNLNQNPRMEILWIHESPGLVGFLETIVDEVFGRTSAGVNFEGAKSHRQEWQRTMQATGEKFDDATEADPGDADGEEG